jgi:hypothetical protein
MGNCCSKELILDDERNMNSLKILNNKNIMKHIGLTPVDYFVYNRNDLLLTRL